MHTVVPAKSRDPYSAADVANGTSRSSVVKPSKFVVMGPGLRRDDTDCVVAALAQMSYNDPSLDGTLSRTAAKHMPIIA